MAITVRKGLYKDFDKNKLLPGELATPLDTKELYAAFAPGDIKKIATYEDMEANIEQATDGIVSDLTVGVNQAATNANNKAIYAQTQGDYAKNQGDYAKAKGVEAQAIVDSASPIINTNLQATYKDKLSNANGTFITCPASDDGLVHVKKIEGETVQVVSNQGKNYIDQKMFNTMTFNGITITNTNGVITLNGTATSSVDIYIMTATNVSFYKGAVGLLTAMNKLATKITLSNNLGLANYFYDGTVFPSNTTLSGNLVSAFVRIPSGQTYSNVELRIQLELGTTATAYEQFTPNSPSVEYPSALKYANNFNAMTSNENLIPDTTQRTNLISGVTFQSHSDGSITINGTATANADFPLHGTYGSASPFKRRIPSGTYTLNGTGNPNVICYVTEDMTTIVSANTNKTTITLPTDRYITFLMVRVNAGVTVSNLKVYPQLVQGSVEKPYTQHQEDKINISFPFMSVPLAKNSCEYDVSGKYTSRVRVKERVFNGTETFVGDATGVGGKRRWRLPITDSIISATSGIGNVQCTHFKNIGANDTWTGLQNGITANTVSAAIYIYNEEFATWTDVQFKAWVLAQYNAGTPLTVQYQLASTIVTPISDIYLKSWKGTTNLLTTSDPQVTLTADFKSELESMRIKHEDALKSKFDVNSEIEFTEATSDVDIVNKDTLPALFGKILKSIKTLRSGLALKINKTDIINNDTTGGADKVSSAEVAKLLGMEIDTLNNSLSNKTSKVYSGTIESNVKNTIMEHWSSVPYGASICSLHQGSQCVALVGKTSEIWGSVHIIGYSLEAPLFGKLINGTWNWVNDGSVIPITDVPAYGVHQSGGYIKIGRTVKVNVRVSITTQVPAFTAFVNGLPSIVTGLSLLSAMSTNGGVVNGIYIDINTIKSNAILPVGVYVISGSYISN